LWLGTWEVSVKFSLLRSLISQEIHSSEWWMTNGSFFCYFLSFELIWREGKKCRLFVSSELSSRTGQNVVSYGSETIETLILLTLRMTVKINTPVVLIYWRWIGSKISKLEITVTNLIDFYNIVIIKLKYAYWI